MAWLLDDAKKLLLIFLGMIKLLIVKRFMLKGVGVQCYVCNLEMVL